MKIAISSEGESLDSMVSEKGGRAPYYLIFENKNLVEVIKNPFAVGGGGAGFSVAYMLADKGVEMIITGQIGENMKNALEEKGISFKQEENKTVQQILNFL